MFALNDLSLSEVSAQETLQEIFALRVLAWRGQANVPRSVRVWTDAVDLAAYHWAIFQGQKLVAAARLSVHMNVADLPDAEIYPGIPLNVRTPIGSLNRCIVHPDLRHHGVATALDKTRIT